MTLLTQIGTGAIKDNAVTTAKISDANVTVAKLTSSLDLTGKTVSLAPGVGDLDWTESVQTGNFTAVAG